MDVYAFRAGKFAIESTDEIVCADEIVQYCMRFKDRWLEQNEWLLEDLPVGASKFVETKLLIRPYDPARPRPSSRRRFTHALAASEKTEPDTVFIAVSSTQEYDQQEASMVAARSTRQMKVQQLVNELKPSASQAVRWEDLAANLQALCRGKNLSPDKCWLSRSSGKEADYREFYARIKGPVPDGVWLLHKCDNRKCMNPNHLMPGTPKENTRDMMKRGRHSAQKRGTYRGRDEWKE